jgi:hypothetical protein
MKSESQHPIFDDGESGEPARVDLSPAEQFRARGYTEVEPGVFDTPLGARVEFSTTDRHEYDHEARGPYPFGDPDFDLVSKYGG